VRATVFHGPGDIRIEEVPDPRIEAGTDAIVKVVHAGICGSDLWKYKGSSQFEPGGRIGHEFVGVVMEVGREVTSVRAGDVVAAGFMYSDGTCEFCRHGLTTSCLNGGFWGGKSGDGGQGEAVRVPLADGTLVKVPLDATDPRMAGVLALTDVMSTGYHAARSARVEPGSTVAVIGDGAVGLCGVLAARLLGAERIILASRNEARAAIGRQFGATDVIPGRGEEAVDEIRALTCGLGPHAVLECVGTADSLRTATESVRPGGAVGYVGAPQHADALNNIRSLFSRNITLSGGLAPARTYLPTLLDEVLAGRLDPSPVFDHRVGLAEVPDAYRAMNDRVVLKALVSP
jgi:threonine dehydrogenase-like Zn-dependent dehydrogenase